MAKKTLLKYSTLITLILVVISACSSLEVDLAEIEYNDPVRIGVLLPLSIERAGEESAYLATVFAAEEINSQGGVLGRDIEIVVRDDAASETRGVREAQQLFEEGIDIIVGPAWSSVTLAVTNQVTIPNGMLLISHSATSPRITQLDDNGLVWRLPPSDSFQGRLGAEYVCNNLNKKTVGILYSSSAWATDLAAEFKKTFEECAGENSVVSFVTYPEGQDWTIYDFEPHLDELFQNRPEAIYLVSYSKDGAKITNDIYYGDYLSDSYMPSFFSNDGPYGFDFLVNGHPEILNGMRGTQPAGDLDDPNYQLFINNYVNRFGFRPEPFSEQIYDAIYLIAYAGLSAGSFEPDAIASQLRNVSGYSQGVPYSEINVNEFLRGKELIEEGSDIDYNGASGEINFDENGDPGCGLYVIWKIENGNYVIESTVKF